MEKGHWKNQTPEKYIDKLTDLFSDILFAGYIEKPEWDVTRRKGYHEALITLETYELIQKRMKKEGIGKRIRLDISPDFLVRGLTLCVGCKNTLTAGWTTGRSGKYPFYKCQKKGCQYYGKSIRKKDIEDGFDALLKKQVLKNKVGIVVEKVFDDEWDEETSSIKQSEVIREQQKKKLMEKMKQLSELIISTKSINVRNVYENQIEEIANKIELLEPDSLNGIDLMIPYRTALEKATGLLKSPYDVWVNLDIREQHALFYFIFEEKLPYDMKYGYRTEEISTAVRLFEEFVTTNPHDVEMGGSEPPCRRLL